MDSIMSGLQAQQQPAPAEAGDGKQGFTPPPVETYTQPDQRDAVDRVVAAAARILYKGEMQDQIQEQLAMDVGMAQKLAESATGLLLTIDNMSQSGIPEAVLAPAAQALLGEAVEIAQAAGQEVTEEDYRDASMMTYHMIAKRLGYSDEQVMQAAGGFVQGEEEGQPQ